MKKSLALSLAILLLLSLAACGGKAPKAPGEVKGETYDVGEFTVLVPEGWMAFPVKDIFEDGNATDQVNICKGGKTDFDLLTKPSVQVTFYAEGSYGSIKSFYTDPTDIDAFTLGDYSWTGFTCTSFDIPYTILECDTADGPSLQVSITEKSSGKEKIALEDADVQAILLSISYPKTAAAGGSDNGGADPVVPVEGGSATGTELYNWKDRVQLRYDPASFAYDEQWEQLSGIDSWLSISLTGFSEDMGSWYATYTEESGGYVTADDYSFSETTLDGYKAYVCTYTDSMGGYKDVIIDVENVFDEPNCVTIRLRASGDTLEDVESQAVTEVISSFTVLG